MTETRGEEVEEEEEERVVQQDHGNNNLPDDEVSVEQMFEGKEVPKWTEQLTPRALVISLVLGFGMTYLSMRLTLQDGETISFNLLFAPLTFVILKVWTILMEKLGFLKTPFTRQENTVVHSCLLACLSITLNGGFGSYYLAMNPYIALVYKDPADTKQLNPSWLIMFLFLISFIGIFTVVPLAKVLLIRHKLYYPSGMSVGNIINNLHETNHTPIGRKQNDFLLKAIIGTMSWNSFTWLYALDPTCGFSNIPVFGVKAFNVGFSMNFSPASIGAGMICNPMVGISMLVGGIISSAYLWPWVDSKEGVWYKPQQPFLSMTGKSGYMISTTIAIAFGDGIYHMAVVILQVCYEFYTRRKQKHIILPFKLWTGPEIPNMSYDDRRRTNLFVQDKIPVQMAMGGYLLFASISIIIIPVLFPSLHSYQIAVAYILAPLLSFSNAYCAGLTDWNLSAVFSKFALFILGAWSTSDKPGSVLASLAACGVVTAVVNTASDLMTDFRTGYMTMTSPRSMFVAQIAGTAMGCIMAPACYMFYAPESPGLLSKPQQQYPAEYASTYRIMAEFSIKGFTMLPEYSVMMFVCFFLGTILVNVFREVAKGRKWRIYPFIPSLLPMAITFFSGPSYAFDMLLGSLVAYLWKRKNKRHADMFLSLAASGLIVGDAFSSVTSNILNRFNIVPLYCMRVLPRDTAEKVAGFLAKTP